MSTIITTGPNQGTRKTKVSRMAFWRPDTEEWIYLPVDRAHNQQILEEDEEGNSLGSMGIYESKGWLPVRQAQSIPKAMKALPSNWRDVANRGAAPIFTDEEAPAKAPAKAKAETF
jgi:hypothetical protein